MIKRLSPVKLELVIIITSALLWNILNRSNIIALPYEFLIESTFIFLLIELLVLKNPSLRHFRFGFVALVLSAIGDTLKIWEITATSTVAVLCFLILGLINYLFFYHD